MKKEFTIKLSFTQLIGVITTCITIIGSSFGAGVKVYLEIAKVERAKLEAELIEKYESNLSELRQTSRLCNEDLNFYKIQYQIYFERYKNLLEDKMMLNNTIKKIAESSEEKE